MRLALDGGMRCSETRRLCTDSFMMVGCLVVGGFLTRVLNEGAAGADNDLDLDALNGTNHEQDSIDRVLDILGGIKEVDTCGIASVK